MVVVRGKGADFWRLQDAVSPLTRCDTLRTHFFPDLLEHVAHLFLHLSALPLGTEYRATFLTALPAAGFLGIGANLPSTKHSPRSKCETLRARHRDDVPQRTIENRPVALVDAEGRLAVVLGVLVCLGNNPDGSIRDALDGQSTTLVVEKTPK